MLTWLDLEPTRIAMSKGKEKLAKEGDLWLMPMA